MQAHVAEGQANVEKELDELREVIKKQKVGIGHGGGAISLNFDSEFYFEIC